MFVCSMCGHESEEQCGHVTLSAQVKKWQGVVESNLVVADGVREKLRLAELQKNVLYNALFQIVGIMQGSGLDREVFENVYKIAKKYTVEKPKCEHHIPCDCPDCKKIGAVCVKCDRPAS